ncbi:MAG: type II secretion system F family protein [Planctomycetota bacterium]|nr:type II secretion system F family protein [Planctomycetota bacterium]
MAAGAARTRSFLTRYRMELLARLAFVNTFVPTPRYRNYIDRLIRESASEDVYTFESFLAAQEVWALFCGAAYLLVIDPTLPVGLVMALFGFCVPIARIGAARSKRLKSIRKDLPYMMDLLTLSVQAGADFVFAIQNIIEQFPDRPLRDELRLLLAAIRAGASRKEALLKLKSRVLLAEISALTGALIRADEMGTGLVEVLRSQSAFIKNKRMQELREKAKRAATLMVVPLILFVFPCMFLMILGPIAIRLFMTLMAG